MTTRRHLALAFGVLAAAFTVRAQAQEPPELIRLRSSYEAAVARQVQPLTETYLTELTKLQDQYTKAAKLEEALAIAAEIKIARARLGLSETGTAAETKAALPAAKAADKRARVTIPANSPDGYRIGPVSRGDVITLEYVEGLWKEHGGIPTANPDDPKADGGEANRLVIARGADNGAPGEVIKIVPPETRGKPFTYVFQTSRDNVVLRINTNSDRKANPGQVTYSMKLERQGR